MKAKVFAIRALTIRIFAQARGKHREAPESRAFEDAYSGLFAIYAISFIIILVLLQGLCGAIKDLLRCPTLSCKLSVLMIGMTLIRFLFISRTLADLDDASVNHANGTRLHNRGVLSPACSSQM